MRTKVVLKLGKSQYEGHIQVVEDNFRLGFGYSPPLIAEIKACMKGSRWLGRDGGPKVWAFPVCRHNQWQLDTLLGNNPYKHYDVPLPELQFDRRLLYAKGTYLEVDLYGHQKSMVCQIVGRRSTELAAEMGVGKTLAAIEAIERVDVEKDESECWWVGSRSSLAAFELEKRAWGTKIHPLMMTYDKMVRKVVELSKSLKVPKLVVFDESQYIKSPDSQRSQAAFYLAEAMRDAHGEFPYIVLMSGSPAPNSPLDWYNQCETACPGFLREGDKYKFQNRLGLWIQKTSSLTGGMYPERVTWWDDERKCKHCGVLKDDHYRADSVAAMNTTDSHEWEKSKNEVELLYRRMKGLVQVHFKRDCLDLPEKVYRIFRVDPTPSTVRAANLIKKTAKSAVMALTLLRELSDGFQYVDVPSEMVRCPLCQGHKKIMAPEAVETLLPEEGIAPWEEFHEPTEMVEEDCPKCNGLGEIPAFTREAQMVKCPKMDVVDDMLDEHSDVGRLVFFAGFTGSIDSLCLRVKEKGWNYIRVDGRGWATSLQLKRAKSADLLDVFQNRQDLGKIAYIGHPGSGGVGITLTASPTLVYYSNDFIPVNRIQSEDRIHRPGMDVNKGATIVDIFHLSSDEYIFDKLRAKRLLQDLSLGAMWEEMKKYEGPRAA